MILVVSVDEGTMDSLPDIFQLMIIFGNSQLVSFPSRYKQITLN